MGQSSARVALQPDGNGRYMVTIRHGDEVVAEVEAQSLMAGWAIIRSKMRQMRAAATWDARQR